MPLILSFFGVFLVFYLGGCHETVWNLFVWEKNLRCGAGVENIATTNGTTPLPDNGQMRVWHWYSDRLVLGPGTGAPLQTLLQRR